MKLSLVLGIVVLFFAGSEVCQGLAYGRVAPGYGEAESPDNEPSYGQEDDPMLRDLNWNNFVEDEMDKAKEKAENEQGGDATGKGCVQFISGIEEACISFPNTLTYKGSIFSHDDVCYPEGEPMRLNPDVNPNYSADTFRSKLLAAGMKHGRPYLAIGGGCVMLKEENDDNSRVSTSTSTTTTPLPTRARPLHYPTRPRDTDAILNRTLGPDWPLISVPCPANGLVGIACKFGQSRTPNPWQDNFKDNGRMDEDNLEDSSNKESTFDNEGPKGINTYEETESYRGSGGGGGGGGGVHIVYFGVGGAGAVVLIVIVVLIRCARMGAFAARINRRCTRQTTVSVRSRPLAGAAMMTRAVGASRGHTEAFAASGGTINTISAPYSRLDEETPEPVKT